MDFYSWMGVAIKKLSILGSTGSIGKNALNIVEYHRDKFEIIGLSANVNAELLLKQALKFRPKVICISDESKREFLTTSLDGIDIEVYSGRTGLLELASMDDVDLLLNAIVGSAGMEPTIKGIRAGTDIALSNKESMVMAGKIINDLLEEHSVNLFPVDSEHSAIWQCLQGEKRNQVSRIILTGSGGPFRTLPREEFNNVKKKDALNHPNWDMGNKITIDSATMANKGLEVIEAHWLFGIPVELIDVVIHPQSIIHSMVEFSDGSIKAQLGVPDMKVPIQYALLYPDHLEPRWEKLDFTQEHALTFEPPDFKRFRCLHLAIESLKSGGTTPAVFNVANEIAVDRFLSEKIRFNEIPEMIESALENHNPTSEPDLQQILETEQWTYDYLKPNLI